MRRKVAALFMAGVMVISGTSMAYAEELTDGADFVGTEDSVLSSEGADESDQLETAENLEEASGVQQDELGGEPEVAEDEDPEDEAAAQEGGIPLDEAHFPDAAFRDFLWNNFDDDMDEILSEEEIALITEMRLRGEEVSSLQGIEYLTSLEGLDISGTDLEEVDVSGMTNLGYIYLDNTRIRSLNVAGALNLQELACTSGELESLDVSGMTSLMYLYCENNKLRSLNVAGASNLQELVCTSNELTTLDASGLANLERLDCASNQLSELKLAGLKNLKDLSCYDNKLKSIDLAGLDQLVSLNCSVNPIEKLDASSLKTLTGLGCGECNLTELNVAGLTELRSLDCPDNKLKSLDLTGITKLAMLYCPGNEIESLDISKNPDLRELGCENNQLKTLKISGLAKLYYITCGYNQLEELDLSGLTALGTLKCESNNLTKLDVTGLENLNYLCCTDNLFASQNSITGVEKIKHLDFEPQRHVHVYKDVVTKATLTKDGSIVKKCEGCGEVQETKVIYAPKTITLKQTQFTYNGTNRKPSVSVVDSQGKAISSANYSVVYPTASKAPGTYEAKIVFKGNYSGEITKSYTVVKANQTISMANATKCISSRTYTIRATITQGNKTGKISYTSDNPAVASITSWGKITFNGVGTAKITATTKANANYNSASKTITLTVIPAPTVVTKLQSQKTGWLNIQYRANRAADGYQIQYGTSEDMSGAKYAAVNNSAIRSYTRKDVESGKTYYVRVRTFNVVNGKRYYSNWSGTKDITVK